jgi:hypothetical protein
MPGKFENYDALDPETDLDANERTGLIAMPCNAVFTDLDAIGQVEDYAAKWQITYRHPKGSPQAQKLFAVCDLIARKTWKADADEKLEAIWGCIENGIPPRNSNISLQDGDLHKPEYNARNWLIKASRREDEGRPALYDTQGASIYDPINAVDVEDEEIVGDESQVVRPGDFCMVLMRVWAQAKRERLNFSVEGVRLVKRGAGAKAAGIAQRNEALGALAAGVMPELPSGFEEEEEAPKPKRKAPKKKAAKKKAAKGTVFRKRGK